MNSVWDAPLRVYLEGSFLRWMLDVGDIKTNWGVLGKMEKWYNSRQICSQVRGTKIIREVLIYEYFEYRACF